MKGCYKNSKGRTRKSRKEKRRKKSQLTWNQGKLRCMRGQGMKVPPWRVRKHQGRLFFYRHKSLHAPPEYNGLAYSLMCTTHMPTTSLFFFFVFVVVIVVVVIKMPNYSSLDLIITKKAWMKVWKIPHNLIKEIF